jgi:hypothetical protein
MNHLCVHSIDPALIVNLTGTGLCHAEIIAGMSKIGQCLALNSDLFDSSFLTSFLADKYIHFLTVSEYECATCSAVATTRSQIVASGHGQCFTAYTMQVQRGERPNSDASPSELADAAGAGHHDMVLALLDAGVDVNQADDDGTTALLMASGHGHQSMVDSLLSVDDIDVNQADAGGMTPLFAASCSGHQSVVDSLLAVDGIDVNKARIRVWTGDRTDDGTTPLFAVSFCFKVQVVFNLLLCSFVRCNSAVFVFMSTGV